MRAAAIDWSAEDDDLETAAAELGSDLLNSLAGVIDPDHLLTGIPAVTFAGARIWVDSGDPDPHFQPGFPQDESADPE